MVFAVPLDRMPGSDLIRAASRQDAPRELVWCGVAPGGANSSSGCGSGVAERLVRRNQTILFMRYGILFAARPLSGLFF